MDKTEYSNLWLLIFNGKCISIVINKKRISRFFHCNSLFQKLVHFELTSGNEASERTLY
jgi:hypothetical protein